jgi:hypothetical protein
MDKGLTNGQKLDLLEIASFGHNWKFERFKVDLRFVLNSMGHIKDDVGQY